MFSSLRSALWQLTVMEHIDLYRGETPRAPLGVFSTFVRKKLVEKELTFRFSEKTISNGGCYRLLFPHLKSKLTYRYFSKIGLSGRTYEIDLLLGKDLRPVKVYYMIPDKENFPMLMDRLIREKSLGEIPPYTHVIYKNELNLNRNRHLTIGDIRENIATLHKIVVENKITKLYMFGTGIKAEYMIRHDWSQLEILDVRGNRWSWRDKRKMCEKLSPDTLICWKRRHKMTAVRKRSHGSFKLKVRVPVDGDGSIMYVSLPPVIHKLE